MSSENFGAYAAYYSLFYDADKDTAAEADFVAARIRAAAPGAASLLDLGCGAGRHLVPLAERGFAVAGVDRSPDMLAQARARLDSAGRTDIPLHQADIRDLDLGRTFDAVVSLFHVFSYLADNAALAAGMAAAARHLAPGGVFLFDFWYGPAVLAQRPEPRTRTASDQRFAATRQAHPLLRINQNLVDVRFNVAVRRLDTGQTEEFSETHVMRYLFLPETAHFLEAAGLTPLGFGEWLTGREPGEDTWGVFGLARKA
jgi:SAM-dependent methyltransferase